MACKGFLECLLKLLNFLLTLLGLAMVGYGIYLFVMYKFVKDDLDIVPSNEGLIHLGRPMLMAVSLSSDGNLPTAWFLYLFIGVGAILSVISCFGFIGAATKSGFYLTCYSVLVILLILVEVGCAAFIFFDKSWRAEIPTDKTGNFDMIYGFLRKNWNICKWVALGVVILEALIFLLALMLRAANAPAHHHYSDYESTAHPTEQCQPLIDSQAVPTTGVPVAGTHDNPHRYDAWSRRMMGKYGLATSKSTYNPNDSNRQASTQPTEKSCCSIM